MTAILTASPGRSLGLRALRQVRDFVPAVVLFVVGIGLWEGLTRALHVQQFLLPPPSKIASTLFDQAGTLWGAGFYTWKEALGGFAIGSGLGIVFAVIVGRFRRVGTALMPIAIAANAIPIIAFAPIFNAWFDPLAPFSKMAVAAVLCFLPVMVNTLRGLTSVRREQLELMASYAAGGLTTFRRVRFPTALPYVFTALKVASVLSMIGAVVGEYFGGSFNALGVLIRSRAQILDFPAAWAAIVVACVYGIAFYAAIALAERLVVRWAPGSRDS